MSKYDYSPQYIALSQLRSALKSKRNVKKKNFLVKGLVALGLDVNYAIPLDAPVAQFAPELLGWTALHFAIKFQEEKIISSFLNLGAKVTITNNYDFSPIRLAIEYRWRNQKDRCIKSKGIIKNFMVKLMLKVQREQNDTSNPSCKLGISHLHIACMMNDVNMVKFLLKSGASAEAAISPDSPDLAGFRPIHVAVRYCAVETLKLLLNSGADLWAREARGLSPLQLLIESNMELSDIAPHFLHETSEMSFKLLLKLSSTNADMANLMLAHCSVESLQDKYGLEPLHVVASMRDSAMLEKMLKDNPEINIHAAISANSPHWPGYTSLHFAARCGNNAVKILVERGASLCIADAGGITPFDMCLNKYEPVVLSEIMSFDVTLKGITFNASSQTTVCDAVKALQNTDYVKEFLRTIRSIDEPVSLDSSLWPGCTLLHLAVALVQPKVEEPYLQSLRNAFGFPNFRRESTVDRENVFHDILTKFKANPMAQDIRNCTPIHLAFRQSKCKLVKSLLNHIAQTVKQLDNVTDFGGLSILHIGSVANTHEKLMNALLLNNADVDVRTVSQLRFRWYDNYSDVQLHLNSGSTPLHFAAAIKSRCIEYLIERGADPLALDANGVTPLILTFITSRDSCSTYFANLLLSASSASKCDVVTVEGLSNFHLACWSNNVTTVNLFLNRGVDVNAKINCGLNDTYADCPRALKSPENDINSRGANGSLLLATHAGYTPLHFAVEYNSFEVAEMLVYRGADVHALNARGMSPLHMALTHKYSNCFKLVNILVENIDMSKSGPIDDYGITPLHIDCRLLQTDRIKEQRYLSTDVNARIVDHSPIWPGCTPLHVLNNNRLMNSAVGGARMTAVIEIAELLICRGADVTILNADNVMPLHTVTHLSSRNFDVPGVYLSNKLKAYNINEVNVEGLSILHIACLASNLKVVTELCSQGADVNQPIDYFAEEMGGCVPLHFAAMISNAKIIEFLMQKGADVNAKDFYNRTPLHYFCRYEESSGKGVISTLYGHGANIHAQDVLGQTPLEILVQKPLAKKHINRLLGYGALLNAVNPISGVSIISKVISNSSKYYTDIFDNAQAHDILSVMQDGSTALHNTVRGRTNNFHVNVDYASSIIEKLLKRGCYINAKDNRGRTALHLAVEYGNHMGVCSLLASGININITDNHGIVASDLCTNQTFDSENISLSFFMHLHKLKTLKMEINEPNSKLYEEKLSQGFPPNDLNNTLYSMEKEHAEMEIVMLHENFSLHEFMSERAIREHPMLPRAHRYAIIEHLGGNDKLYKQFPRYRGLIKYQYQRLLERANIIGPATYALGRLMNDTMPNPCLDKITSYLNNEDLKTLIVMTKSSRKKNRNAEFKKRKKFKSA